MAEEISLAGLVVNLLLNTASFEQGSNKAQKIANKTAKDIEGGFRTASSRISTLFGNLGSAVGGPLGQVGAQVGALTRSFGEMGVAMGPVSIGLTALGAAMAGISAYAIHVAKDTAEAVDKMGKLAQSSGIAVTSLSRLAAAARSDEIDAQTLANGLERMNRAALRSAQTTTLASDGFATLGIKVTDAQGHLRPTEDLLAAIADKFSNMADGSAKTAIAMEIFGRAGAQLIPLLDKGGEELRQWAEFSDRVGATMDGRARAAAQRFSEEMAKVDLIMQGARIGLMEGLIPAINRLVDAFATAEQRGTAFESLGKGLGNVLIDLAEMAESAAGMFERLGYATSFIKGDITWKQFREEMARSEYEFDQFEMKLRGAAFYNQGLNLDPFTGLKAGSNAGFEILDRLKQELGVNKTSLNVLGDAMANAADQTAQLLSQLQQLQQAVDDVLHKNDTAVDKELRSLDELIAKVQDYQRAWAQSFGGINTIGNQLLESLEKQKQAIIEQNDALLKQLGLLAQRNSAGHAMEIAPSGEAPLLGPQLGIKPPEIPEVLTKPLPSEMPVYTGGEFAKRLEEIRRSNQAAQEAADKVKESIQDENDKYREQMAILEELSKQGKLTQEEFAAAASKAAEAIVNEWKQAFDQIGSAFQTLINGWLQGTQSLSQAAKKMGDALLSAIVSAQAKRIEGSLAERAAGTAGRPGFEGAVFGAMGKLFGVKNTAQPGSSPSNPIFTKSVDQLPGLNSAALSSLPLSKAPSGLGELLSTAAMFIPGFYSGGAVKGPGGPTSDSVPAFLSAGEYVLKAEAVRKIGMPHLDALNAGMHVVHFAQGGAVIPGRDYIFREQRMDFAMPASVYGEMPRMDFADGPPEIVNHFHGVQDGDTFKRSQSQMAGWFTRTLYAARRNG